MFGYLLTSVNKLLANSTEYNNKNTRNKWLSGLKHTENAACSMKPN